MKICWILAVLVLNFYEHASVNGDTVHYQFARKNCPAGCYHDPVADKCKKVPGGGEMVKIKLDSRCGGGFLGLMPHSKKSRFYYVCKCDSVLTCMCKPDEHFDRLKLKCERRSRRKEEMSYDIVDQVMEKYKCAVMNGIYKGKQCVIPKFEAPVSPVVTTIPVDVKKRTDQIRNILSYLEYLKNVGNQVRSQESFETISLPPQPAVIFQLPTITTTPLPPTTLQVQIKKILSTIESGLNEFNQLFVTTSTPAFTERFFGLTTMESVDARFMDKELNAQEEEETTQSFKALFGKSLGDDGSSLATTSPKKMDIMDEKLTAQEEEQTTQSFTSLFGKSFGDDGSSLATTSPKKMDMKLKTKEENGQKIKYYEYYFEDNPDTVIGVSNPVKIKSEEKVEEGVDEHWKKTVTVENGTTTLFPEAQELTKADEKNFYGAELITEEQPATTISYQDSTTEMAPEPLKKWPGDLNFNDFDLDTTKVTETTTIASSDMTSTTDLIDDEATELFLKKSFEGESTTNVQETSTTEEGTTSFVETSTTEMATTFVDPEYSTINNIQESTDIQTSTTEGDIFSTKMTTLLDENTDKETTKIFDAENEGFDAKFMDEEFGSTADLATETTSLPESSSQLTTDDMLYTTIDFQSTNFDMLSTTVDSQPTTVDIQSTTVGSQPTTVDSQPETVDIQSTTVDSQSTTVDIESTTIPIKSDTKDDDDDDVKKLSTLIPSGITIGGKFGIKLAQSALSGATTLNTQPPKRKRVKTTSMAPPLVTEKPEDNKSKDYEVYYSYEDYEVDENGQEIMSQIKEDVDKKMKTRKIKKKKLRDSSDEYYADSKSASLERRDSKERLHAANVRDEYAYFF